MIKQLLILLLLTLPLAAETLNGVAIMVKDRPITLFDLKEEMRKSGQTQEAAINVLVRSELEALEADERGITVTNREVHDDLKKIAEQNGVTVMELYLSMQQKQNMTEKELKEKIRTKLLTQKLYGAIAYERLQEADSSEIEEYYNLHIAEFSHPSTITATIYRSPSEAKLQEKLANPMLYAPQIKQENVTLEYDKINPQLAALLTQTEPYSFTQIFPDQNGFISFYVQKKSDITTQPLEAVRNQIINAIMQEKRQQVLNDYFTRLKLNTEVKTIRLP